MFSRSVLMKANNAVSKHWSSSGDAGHSSGDNEAGYPMDGEETESTEAEQEKPEYLKDVQTDIPRVSISMDTSSAKSVETCLEVSLDPATPDSRASSTTKLLPQEAEMTACAAMPNSCPRRKKQLLRSQTMATSRRVSMTGNCHYGYPGITKARDRDSVPVSITHICFAELS